MPQAARSVIPLKARQELIRRVLASRQFASAESLRRIVLFLFERAAAKDGSPVREQEIAIEALRRPASFDPKIDPIVRVGVASIRERLRNYFEQEGRPERLRLSLPKGQYRLHFEPAVEVAAARMTAETAACWRFWQPYLSPLNPNLLVFAEVLFFRDEEGNFMRNIYVNDRVSGAGEVRARLGLAEERELIPSFHFVSAGEMHCLLSVTRVFAEMGAAIESRNSRFFGWSDARRANLILLGSARTNPFVKSLQGSLPLVITEDSIEQRAPRSGQPDRWTGQRFRDGDLERVVEYALVTRRAGPVAGTTVTMIGANHGRAIEGAGRFLTDESHLRGLEEAFGGNGLPAQFQLLLRVEMLDYDEAVVDVAYLTHRVLPDGAE